MLQQLTVCTMLKKKWCRASDVIRHDRPLLSNQSGVLRAAPRGPLKSRPRVAPPSTPSKLRSAARRAVKLGYADSEQWSVFRSSSPGSARAIPLSTSRLAVADWGRRHARGQLFFIGGRASNPNKALSLIGFVVHMLGLSKHHSSIKIPPLPRRHHHATWSPAGGEGGATSV